MVATYFFQIKRGNQFICVFITFFFCLNKKLSNQKWLKNSKKRKIIRKSIFFLKNRLVIFYTKPIYSQVQSLRNKIHQKKIVIDLLLDFTTIFPIVHRLHVPTIQPCFLLFLDLKKKWNLGLGWKLVFIAISSFLLSLFFFFVNQTNKWKKRKTHRKYHTFCLVSSTDLKK